MVLTSEVISMVMNLVVLPTHDRPFPIGVFCACYRYHDISKPIYHFLLWFEVLSLVFHMDKCIVVQYVNGAHTIDDYFLLPRSAGGLSLRVLPSDVVWKTLLSCLDLHVCPWGVDDVSPSS